MLLGAFTWMINASIATFVVRRRRQILRATMTVVTPMCISNRRTRMKKRCAKRLWRGVPWKQLVATAIAKAVPGRPKQLVFGLGTPQSKLGCSFAL
jgi:hypothetical protein